MRDRNKRKLIMYGLMVALMVTTVAYAVLQTTLNINGTVTKKGGSWDIHFANLSTPSLTGDASSTNASIQATSFTFSATVEKPKDAIVYTFDVVNGGSIDATLDSITLSGATEAKAQDITYTLTYADGKEIKKGDKLVSGQTRSLKLTVSYDDVDALSANGTTLNLGATLIYVQTDGDGSGSLTPETPVLTSVTLMDLYNDGKVDVNYPSYLSEMKITGDSGTDEGCDNGGLPCGNDFKINLNSYAKLTFSHSDQYMAVTIKMLDGSIHEIKDGYDVTMKVPVVSDSEIIDEEEVHYDSGIFYYIDSIPVKIIAEETMGQQENIVVEGQIEYFSSYAFYGWFTFDEILIEQ